MLPFFTLFKLSRQAQASFMMNVLNNLFSISGGVEGWEPIWRYHPDGRDCQPTAAPEVMVLKWIPATSAEVEIIGDAYLLDGCVLLFPRWVVVSLPSWTAGAPWSASLAKTCRAHRMLQLHSSGHEVA